MKVLHIASHNLEAWKSFVDDSSCVINGYAKFSDLIKTINNYNVRDCLGVIVHETQITDSMQKKLNALNSSAYFTKLNVVVIGDNASKILPAMCNKINRLNVYACDSDSGTISDSDINNILTLLFALGKDIYRIPTSTLTINAESASYDEKSEDAKFLLDIIKRDSLLSKKVVNT